MIINDETIHLYDLIFYYFFPMVLVILYILTRVKADKISLKNLILPHIIKKVQGSAKL